MLRGKHGGLTMAEVAEATTPAMIKQYAGSRLYDAAQGRYVSLNTLRSWAREGIAFQVVDAETGDDITRVLLA
jgi:polyhydroxyalkanoate synthesis regulator protein